MVVARAVWLNGSRLMTTVRLHRLWHWADGLSLQWAHRVYSPLVTRPLIGHNCVGKAVGQLGNIVKLLCGILIRLGLVPRMTLFERLTPKDLMVAALLNIVIPI